jgi:hypothetical protein
MMSGAFGLAAGQTMNSGIITSVRWPFLLRMPFGS